MRLKGIPLATVPQLLAPRRFSFDQPMHVFISVCDHYEPAYGKPARHVQDARVDRWVNDYPKSVQGLCDSRGHVPQHSFFYPGDEYDETHVDQIAELCRRGYGAIEVHLHHRDDTSDGLREKLETYKQILFNRHGALEKNAAGEITYGFIHGNWALDNSHPKGKCCGVNDELSVLRETGCYADFTLPSAPDDCQTSIVNSIYYAIDDPQRPGSHNTGRRAQVGTIPPADGLLMIQGPLLFDWGRRKWGLAPRLENGNLSLQQPATLDRLRLWCAAGVTVANRPDWFFVKLYTHGVEQNKMQMILGEPMRRFHEGLGGLAREFSTFKYYYVTAREMAGLVHQAERGCSAPDWTSLATEWPSPAARQSLTGDRSGVATGSGIPAISIQAH
ncbi:MAG: hypothetical protein JSS02_32750 [Planctomycetes bacterium]|nr:hypothetical protein [Planctomycetota bacterium]